MKTYIHYGHDKLISEEVTRSIPCICTKPDRGLWASPIDSPFGWKQWCESENWMKSDFSKSFKFSLTADARILEIHREEDILPYIISNDWLEDDEIEQNPYSLTSILDELNLDKLYSEFDGIELFLSEDYTMHRGIFNTWDCDSIVVWNPSVIELIE